MLLIAREQSQLFLANGTFTVPLDRTKLYITGAAGGGGGGGGESTNGHSGGGGGGGDSIRRRDVAVTAGTTYNVTIGTGGAGGANGVATGVDGSNGTTTSFDVLLSLTGGFGGKKGIAAANGNGGAPGGLGASAGGTAFLLAQQTANGGSSTFPGGLPPPSPGVCIAGALLMLAAYKLKLLETIPFLFPFLGMATIAPYGSGGFGGNGLSAGGDGAGGYMIVEW